jgi:hypothetical protein
MENDDSANYEQHETEQAFSKVAPVQKVEAKPDENPSADEIKKRIAKFWRIVVADSNKVSLTRILEITGLLIALAALYVYSRQLDTMAGQLREMQGSGEQTAQLIINAAHQAADTHALAENTANEVNKMDESAHQTRRLARATERANENVLDEDRPWIGILIDITGFEANQTPIKTVRLINTGKRPALITSFTTDGDYFKSMSETPPYRGETSIRGQFLVPGTHYEAIVNLFKDDGILKPESLSILNAEIITFFSYASVEYTDKRTGKKYFTHACVRYAPQATERKAGFFGCDSYNDGN